MATTERLAPVRSAPVRSGKVSRRGFLAGSAGLTFALSVPTALFERPNAALQAAAVRRVLMQAAAAKWGVPLADVHTEPSVVVHAASGRRLSYGDIAGFAQVPDTMPAVDKSELKKLADYRILGKDTPRADIPGKTTGAAQYSIDVRVPNMVYATVLQAPVEEAAPDAVDDKATLAIPGVLKVVPMKNSVGIVGESVEAEVPGREAPQVTWSKAPADSYRSDAGPKEVMARAAKADDTGGDYVAQGDPDGAFAKAAKVLSAQYSSEYVYHAQMEPLTITAAINPAGAGAAVWVASQG